MRSLNEYITVDESRQDNLRPTSKKELKELINQRIEEQGPRCDLNDIDVSRITDMSYLFDDTNFNGDISKWNVSSVRGMNGMFNDSKFNGDLSKWDTRSLEECSGIFRNSPLEDNPPSWCHCDK